jgi:hypothetical protein
MQLYKPSDQSYSEPHEFYYVPSVEAKAVATAAAAAAYKLDRNTSHDFEAPKQLQGPI